MKPALTGSPGITKITKTATLIPQIAHAIKKFSKNSFLKVLKKGSGEHRKHNKCSWNTNFV